MKNRRDTIQNFIMVTFDFIYQLRINWWMGSSYKTLDWTLWQREGVISVTGLVKKEKLLVFPFFLFYLANNFNKTLILGRNKKN